jgi:hypothetical protein
MHLNDGVINLLILVLAFVKGKTLNSKMYWIYYAVL